MALDPQADNSEPLNEAAERLLALAEANRTDELEAAWLGAVEDPSIGLGSVLAVLEAVAARQHPKLLESLAWLLLSAWAEKRGTEAALDAAWKARELLPSGDVLRDEIAGLYRKDRPDFPGIETLVQMTLLRKDVPLKDAFVAMEKLLALPPGTYVSDSRRKTPGRVTGADAARKVLAVSFGESERAYDAQTIDVLETLDPTDFRAMAIFDHPGLAAIAKADPAQLVRLVLQAYGPRMGMKDLKSKLMDVAVPADGWSKWWSSARAKIKRDPLIQVSDGTQPDFFLRPRPQAYEAGARDQFDSATTLENRLLVVLAYLGETGHNPEAEAEQLRFFAASLAPRVDPGSKVTPAEVLQVLAVLAEIRRHLGDAAPPLPPVPEALVADKAALAALVGTVRNNEIAGRVFPLVREILPADWPEVFAAAMPLTSQEMCEYAAAQLADANRNDLLAAFATAVMRQPEEGLPALAWLWKTTAGDKFTEGFADLNRAQLTVRLLVAANAVGHPDYPDRVRRIDLLAQVRRVLSSREFGLFRDVLEKTDTGWAKEILSVVQRNHGLTDHIRVQMLEILARVHPAPAVKAIAPWDDEEVVYTSAAALDDKRKEFEHLLHVKLPANSTAIGDAAARGDLSENAEFTAALEERDRLTERANAMQADLARAKVVSSFWAHGDAVHIGTTVRARRLSTGAEEMLTFLGPWDADMKKFIYYYKAPLAKAFMGKRVGETVTLKAESGSEQWEILEIRPAV